MSSASSTSAAGVAWNLNDLYSGHDDPALSADMTRTRADAEAFAETYRGSINVPGGPPAEHLLAAVQQLEVIYDQLYRIAVYADLLFSADTSQPAHRNVQQRTDHHMTAVRNTLLFFDLEWLALPDADAQRVMDDPALAGYRYYLRAARRYTPHTLSEPEERVINEKDLTGLQAWQTFFSELLSDLAFPLEHEGEQQQLTLDKMLHLATRAPDRALRQRAFAGFYGVLGNQAQTLAYLYNTVLQDHLTTNRMRNYSDPMAPRHLDNEIDAAAVETMMDVVEQNYPLAQDYFRLKARLLDLPRLQMYDQYAPLGDQPMQASYAEAQQHVLAALGTFDQRFRDVATDFFEQHWIDAELRPGKRGGAFCAGYPPSNHPYILCNYTDDLRDVMTLAHELGHGIHFALARKQTLFNFRTSLPLIETASVFAEMLVFDHLVQRESNPRAQLALVCSKIEDICATTFRQNVLTRFEQAIFAARSESRLTPEQISEHWLEANRRYYADTVEQTEGYALGWSYIPHFIYTPFYCYSYVFGELLVLALYGMYRDEGAAFVPRYVALLEAGGSQSPDDLLASLGVDIRDPDFWQIGFGELRRLVNWAHELAAA
jgi:oligoendopeptidase F